MRRVVLVFVLFASGAVARSETTMAPAAFEALSEGRTLHFSHDGEPFGAEQFLPGRRTLWRFAEDGCEPGRWHAEGQAICFVYEAIAGPICWSIVQTGEGYAAALLESGAETGFRLDLERISDEPLPCPGPRVGT